MNTPSLAARIELEDIYPEVPKQPPEGGGWENCNSLQGVVEGLKEHYGFPHPVALVAIHYFTWPPSVDLDDFNLDDQNTWGKGKDLNVVKELLNRIVAAVAVGTLLRKKGYIVRYINPTGDMEWKGQLNSKRIVDTIFEKLSVKLNKSLELSHAGSAVSTTSEAEVIVAGAQREATAAGQRQEDTSPAVIITVTSGYHALRVMNELNHQAGIPTAKGEVTTRVLGIDMRSGEEKDCPFLQGAKLDADLIDLLKRTAIDPALEASQHKRERTLRKVPGKFMDAIASITRASGDNLKWLSEVLGKLTDQQHVRGSKKEKGDYES